jgi:hypothetical protein
MDGAVEVKLHTFLTSAIDVSDQLYAWADLSSTNEALYSI